MTKSRSITISALCLALFAPTGLHAQQRIADPVDVGSIEAIVRTSYEVISGPAGAPRQWRRDSTLYAPHATLTAVAEHDGKPVVTTVTAEEYRNMVNDRLVATGLFQREVGSRIERFGNVAVVRSVYELRRQDKGPVQQRGVNYYTLYYDGTRWWITAVLWDEERQTNRLPRTWIGRTERVNFPVPPRSGSRR